MLMSARRKPLSAAPSTFHGAHTLSEERLSDHDNKDEPTENGSGWLHLHASNYLWFLEG